MVDAKATGKMIQNKRKLKGLTQLQLAERLNISNRTVSKWENGDGFPDITLLPELAKELDISIDALLTGEEKPAKAEIVVTAVPDNMKKINTKYLISKIVGFVLILMGSAIGIVTELGLLGVRPFYVFIEIYLLVFSLVVLAVGAIVFLTGFVRYLGEVEQIKKSNCIELLIFIYAVTLLPAVAGVRMLKWSGTYVFLYLFIGVVVLLYIVILLLAKKYIQNKFGEK